MVRIKKLFLSRLDTYARKVVREEHSRVELLIPSMHGKLCDWSHGTLLTCLQRIRKNPHSSRGANIHRTDFCFFRSLHHCGKCSRGMAGIYDFVASATNQIETFFLTYCNILFCTSRKTGVRRMYWLCRYKGSSASAHSPFVIVEVHVPYTWTLVWNSEESCIRRICPAN